jgi:cytochrome c biogenesis protein CcdA
MRSRPAYGHSCATPFPDQGVKVTFGTATYGLGLVAGALSTLSPCVLPLVPVLIASAVNAHRWGAVALGTGLALSFAIIGIFLATVGASLASVPLWAQPRRSRVTAET